MRTWGTTELQSNYGMDVIVAARRKKIDIATFNMLARLLPF